MLILWRPPEWHQRAACRGALALFFGTQSTGCHEKAAALCAGCPVFAECRAWADATQIEDGYFAGESAADRKARWKAEGRPVDRRPRREREAKPKRRTTPEQAEENRRRRHRVSPNLYDTYDADCRPVVLRSRGRIYVTADGTEVPY